MAAALGAWPWRVAPALRAAGARNGAARALAGSAAPATSKGKPDGKLAPKQDKIKHFKIYRYNPDVGGKPTMVDYPINLRECGPMVSGGDIVIRPRLREGKGGLCPYARSPPCSRSVSVA